MYNNNTVCVTVCIITQTRPLLKVPWFGVCLLCCEPSLTCCPHLAQTCVSEGVKSGCSGAEVTSPLTFVLSCSKTVAGKLLEIPESLVCSSVVLFSLG